MLNDDELRSLRIPVFFWTINLKGIQESPHRFHQYTGTFQQLLKWGATAVSFLSSLTVCLNARMSVVVM